MAEWAHLFTARQLTALCTFSDLVTEAREQILTDALAAGMDNDPTPLREGGTGTTAYAEAVSVYLAFAVSKLADLGNSLCRWEPKAECPRLLFVRHAVAMIWDFAEGNMLGNSSGSWSVIMNGINRSFTSNAWPHSIDAIPAKVQQAEAQSVRAEPQGQLTVSTDPPYYDNIGYADLSDFFYVWLRRSVGTVFPDVCSTLLAPKTDELIAAPYRHSGDKQAAEKFFEDGLGQVFATLRDKQDRRFPMSIYYAFKQSETTDSGGTASTGWETFLEGLIGAGLQITGTWPIRTELANRMRSQASNALASSIVLVCRPRPANAHLTTRRDFLEQLAAELPAALAHLQQANIAPVDMAQAAIGPGMSIYSRYSRVVEADGTTMSVRKALTAINETLDETLDATDTDLDSDTRWALTWYTQHGFDAGDYGQAEQLSKARNTSVQGLVQAGIASSQAGKVKLLNRTQLDENWDPTNDDRLTVWEVTQHLIRQHETGGEIPAANLLQKVKHLAEPARELTYRLYHTCERKNWATEAFAYNALIQSWPQITQLANKPPEGQTKLGL